MRTMICYFSQGGKTKMIAEALAQSQSAELCEISEVKKRNFFTVWTAGLFSARGGKTSDIQPCTISLKGVDRIILMSPIWGGYNAPALNSFIEEVGPKLHGKRVAAVMVSMSGTSKARKNIEAAVVKHGAQFKGCLDVSAKDVAAATESVNDFLSKLQSAK